MREIENVDLCKVPWAETCLLQFLGVTEHRAEEVLRPAPEMAAISWRWNCSKHVYRQGDVWPTCVIISGRR